MLLFSGPTHVLVVRGLDENADEEMLRYEFAKHAPIKVGNKLIYQLVFLLYQHNLTPFFCRISALFGISLLTFLEALPSFISIQ